MGEYLVIEYYQKHEELPTLKSVPVGTKNINALSMNGERYSIKSTSSNVAGVFYGLESPGSKIPDKQLFEYVIICKLDEDCKLESIYELTWDTFIKHKKWHSRMMAWNITLSKAVKVEARIVYERNCYELEGNEKKSANLANVKNELLDNNTVIEEEDVEKDNAIGWNLAEKVDLELIKNTVVENMQKRFCCYWKKLSRSRYESEDKEKALFIMAANYSEKNSEYWYSINDENLPWLELYSICYVVFVLGSEDKVLLFDYKTLKKMLSGCRKTKEDISKRKMAHFHISFAVEGKNVVYFKKKLPEKEFINVTYALIEG